jgi:hypothetical protein
VRETPAVWWGFCIWVQGSKFKVQGLRFKVMRFKVIRFKVIRFKWAVAVGRGSWQLQLAFGSGGEQLAVCRGSVGICTKA